MSFDDFTTELVARFFFFGLGLEGVDEGGADEEGVDGEGVDGEGVDEEGDS